MMAAKDQPTTTGYPLTLDLTGRRVVVVGGGPVAARRAHGLVGAAALVDVVAPAVSEELRTLVERDEVRWLPRDFEVADLREPSPAWFVQTATGVPAVDALVADECDAARV
jgi:uroporphyrin-III C-methyltransferase/precorrin-2 dehydrogenase/sirohydrochlorin ferrochelatase